MQIIIHRNFTIIILLKILTYYFLIAQYILSIFYLQYISKIKLLNPFWMYNVIIYFTYKN